MSGTQLSSDGLDPRRRKILFRAWHRGTREMDLVMGRFADSFLATLSDEQLDDFEALIEVPDRDLFAWVTGEAATPDNWNSPVMRALAAFHGQVKGTEPDADSARAVLEQRAGA
ncbi:MAG: succinate dehydrogenase assembly factor 2 [Pseudomonadota bacterium]